MSTSPSSPSFPRRRLGRFSSRAALAVVVAVVVLFITSIHSLAVFWTDQMWFSQAGFGNVFTTLFVTRLELGLVFGLIFFALMWGNLLLTNRFGARDLTPSVEDIAVARFQAVVRPRARLVYGLIALVMAFVAGLAASSQWQTYELFLHHQSFGAKDALFGMDAGFYVFILPFLSFVATWTLVALFVTLLVTTVFHFLNGGIRAGRPTVQADPRVKAHLSVLGAAIALLKAVGYLIARWHLVNSTHGIVNGAGYTDVHARVPAQSILLFLSVASAVILLVNVRARGWSLPAVAVGLWAFVALVIGVIYPTALQQFKVAPAQSTLEAPYIQRNIAATLSSYGLNHVQFSNFTASNTVPSTELRADAPTLNNVRLWDPNAAIALETVARRQSIRSYYNFASLAVDRYPINGQLTPVLIGTREIDSANLPSSSWVNTHLQYTHGLGVALLAANTAAQGNPVFAVADVPPVSRSGIAPLTKPDVYFGEGLNGWVVTNTKQPELDYQVNAGASAGQLVETHYTGTGGVAVGSVLSRLALAVRLGDFNLLISNQITPKSRVLFVRDITAMAQKAAPFLSYGSQPYPVLVNGGIDYVLDGFTTSDQYPYAQNASGLNVNEGGLPASFNYVRNSVKVVVNAYTGAITYYAIDPSDPILRAYEAIFPGLFKPESQMPAAIATHLRYPQELLSTQAAILGSYHITNASAFYDGSDRWDISPTTGAGTPSQALGTVTSASTAQTTGSTGVTGQVTTSYGPMSPLVQVGSLPGASHQQLLESLAYVPAGKTGQVQTLSAFIEVTSDPKDYGHLSVYTTPRGQSVTGPAQADSEIQQNATVSSIITPLDQHGSQVLLGNDLMIPLDESILYVRPLYVTATTNPMPQLRYVIAVFNQQVAISPTLSGALSQVLGTSVAAGSGTSTAPSGPTKSGQSASYYLNQAASDYTQAQAALKSGNLGAYQVDVNNMNAALVAAQTALAK